MKSLPPPYKNVIVSRAKDGIKNKPSLSPLTANTFRERKAVERRFKEAVQSAGTPALSSLHLDQFHLCVSRFQAR
jgi:hypothetical protein